MQTKPGTPVTEQELFDFAATEIPERAAVPKRVNITASLPVTGVQIQAGLQQLELESVVRAEAVRAGATIADLAHDRDGRGANVLRIRHRRECSGIAECPRSVCIQI